MSNKNEGLRFLQTEFGDLIDMELQPQKLEDLADKTKEKPNPVASKIQTEKTKKIPIEYLGKSFDELYKSDKLQKVKDNFPDLYLKLRKEKYNY